MWNVEKPFLFLSRSATLYLSSLWSDINDSMLAKPRINDWPRIEKNCSFFIMKSIISFRSPTLLSLPLSVSVVVHLSISDMVDKNPFSTGLFQLHSNNNYGDTIEIVSPGFLFCLKDILINLFHVYFSLALYLSLTFSNCVSFFVSLQKWKVLYVLWWAILGYHV